MGGENAINYSKIERKDLHYINRTVLIFSAEAAGLPAQIWFSGPERYCLMFQYDWLLFESWRQVSGDRVRLVSRSC